MKKLIKLSDTHYIIVDDSEIKENGWIFYTTTSVILQWDGKTPSRKNDFKIIHSTQPLNTKFNDWFDVKIISLSEVEEVINGYSVEKMAENYYNTLGKLGTEYDKTTSVNLIIWGFKAHQELVKDKLFTERDMINAFISGTNAGATYDNMSQDDLEEAEEYADTELEEFKQSLLPKTEWDIEVNEQNKITLI